MGRVKVFYELIIHCAIELWEAFEYFWVQWFFSTNQRWGRGGGGTGEEGSWAPDVWCISLEHVGAESVLLELGCGLQRVGLRGDRSQQSTKKNFLMKVWQLLQWGERLIPACVPADPAVRQAWVPVEGCITWCLVCLWLSVNKWFSGITFLSTEGKLPISHLWLYHSKPVWRAQDYYYRTFESLRRVPLFCHPRHLPFYSCVTLWSLDIVFASLNEVGKSIHILSIESYLTKFFYRGVCFIIQCMIWIWGKN